MLCRLPVRPGCRGTARCSEGIARSACDARYAALRTALAMNDLIRNARTDTNTSAMPEHNDSSREYPGTARVVARSLFHPFVPSAARQRGVSRDLRGLRAWLDTPRCARRSP